MITKYNHGESKLKEPGFNNRATFLMNYFFSKKTLTTSIQFKRLTTALSISIGEGVKVKLLAHFQINKRIFLNIK